MYNSYYGFNKRPFSLLPNPEFLYLAKQHDVALSVLDFSVLNQAGFVVVTGEIGTGKTTLIRYMLETLKQNDVTIGLVNNTHRSFGELFQWVLNAFGIDYTDQDRVEQHQLFTNFLIEEYANNKRVVLIIDEAQNMDMEALEELRLLSNINADHDLILQVILVGQAELRKKLQDPSLEQFAQRILTDYHLEALNKDESISYIRHRLSVAGGNSEIFNQHACNYIAYYSRGVPRLINMLCDLALVYGFTQNKDTIDAKVVEEVVRDKLKGGITPLRRPVVKVKSNAMAPA